METLFFPLQPNSVQTQGCTHSIQTSTMDVAAALVALQCSQAKKKKKKKEKENTHTSSCKYGE